MVAKVFLLSSKSDDISEFLYKFYDKEIDIDNSMSWTSDFLNPVDLAEIIAAFVDNISNFDIIMWISLDQNLFIRISPNNADIIIKYLFERYPY